MDLKNVYKLSKALVKFAKVETDKGVLVVNGELAEGVEVLAEGADGEPIDAIDGEYIATDKKIIVKDGKVEKIEVIETKEEELADEPAEQPEEKKEKLAECDKEKLADEPVEGPVKEELDEKDERIAELEGLLKDRDAIVAELTDKIKELEDKLKEPADASVKMSKVVNHTFDVKENPVLKYFEK